MAVRRRRTSSRTRRRSPARTTRRAKGRNTASVAIVAASRPARRRRRPARAAGTRRRRSASGRFVRASASAAPRRRRRRATRATAAPRRRRRRAAAAPAAAPRRRRRRRAAAASAAPRRRRRRTTRALAAAPRRRRRRATRASSRRRTASRRRSPSRYRRAALRAARHPGRRGRFRRTSITRTTRMLDRRTGRHVVVRQTHRLLPNPKTSWREIGFITGGVVLGMIAADMAGRWFVTRQPEGGNHEFYADDAARRIFAKPTPARAAVQGGVGLACLLASAKLKGMGGNLLVGMAIGAFALTGLQLANGYIMPKLYGGVVKGDEMVLGNRLFPWEQPGQQDALVAEFAETSKPTSMAQGGKDGKLPSEYAIWGGSATAGVTGVDTSKARETLNAAANKGGTVGKVGDCGCKKMCSCTACLDAWNNGEIAPHSPAYAANAGANGNAPISTNQINVDQPGPISPLSIPEINIMDVPTLPGPSRVPGEVSRQGAGGEANIVALDDRSMINGLPKPRQLSAPREFLSFESGSAHGQLVALS